MTASPWGLFVFWHQVRFLTRLAFPLGHGNPVALHGIVAAGPAGAGASGGHCRQEPNLGNGGLGDISAPLGWQCWRILFRDTPFQDPRCVRFPQPL